jgi:hypothetical protein
VHAATIQHSWVAVSTPDHQKPSLEPFLGFTGSLCHTGVPSLLNLADDDHHLSLPLITANQVQELQQ